MVPDDRYGKESSYWKWKNGSGNIPPDVDVTNSGEIPEFKEPSEDNLYDGDAKNSIEEWDKKNGRIPLREIFLSVDAIKECMELANSSGEFLKNIMNYSVTINRFTGASFSCGVAIKHLFVCKTCKLCTN